MRAVGIEPTRTRREILSLLWLPLHHARIFLFIVQYYCVVNLWVTSYLAIVPMFYDQVLVRIHTSVCNQQSVHIVLWHTLNYSQCKVRRNLICMEITAQHIHRRVADRLLNLATALAPTMLS